MPSNTKQKRSDNHDLELKILHPMLHVKVSRQTKKKPQEEKKTKPEIKEEPKERRK